MVVRTTLIGSRERLLFALCRFVLVLFMICVHLLAMCVLYVSFGVSVSVTPNILSVCSRVVFVLSICRCSLVLYSAASWCE